MSKRLVLSVVSAVLLAFGSISTVYAQGATGTVSGQTVDSNGNPVAGAIVTVSNPRTGQTRSVTTGAGGNFRMQLSPGVYQLNSSASGYSDVVIETVMVNLGADSAMTIPMADGAIEEIVTYATAREFMPTTTGETGLNISIEELSLLPVARNVESVALLAPGTISGDVAFGDDKSLVSFGGASVAENVYYIDGLNVTNFRNGLGGSSVPFEFYDQFQIKTGGYGAEFGRSTGGVLNAVTKRGSNEFEYGIVTYFEPEILQGESPNTLRADGSFYDFNGENRQSSFTTDLYLSGPIWRDKLFFYVLYEPRETESEFTSLGSPDILNVEKVEDDFWGGNLTWNITDEHSLSYTAFTDERKIVTTEFDYDFGQVVRGAERGQATESRGGDNWVAKYEGNFGDNFAISALYGENKYNLTDLATTDANCPLVVDVRPGRPGSSRPGCETNVLAQVGGDTREAARIDAEWYLGDHTLRAGFDREENASVDSSVYSGIDAYPLAPGGIYYRYETYDIGDQLPNGFVMTDLNANGLPVDTVRVRYIENGGNFSTISQAWYIEDTWQINDEFTLSAGIRNETFENNNAEGLPFIEIDNQWAPRLAFSWSPGGTGEQTVTLNWGRYHLPIAANTNVRLSGAELDYQDYYLYDGNRDASTAVPTAVDGNGTPTTQQLGTRLVNSDGTVPDTRAIIDSSLDPMFQDEWMLQYERELGENWTIGGRYIYRELSSTIDDILVDFGLEALGWDGPIGSGNDCHYVLTNPGTPVTTFCEQYNTPGDPNSGTSLVETTIPADALGFPEAERTYEAFEITLAGNVGDWSMNGSYTWSKNEGNTEGYVKSDIGQDDAGITQDFDIPALMDGALGFLPNDRRHKVKFWTSYQATDRLTLGANLLAQSGRPINAFGDQHPDGAPAYGDTFYLSDGNGGLNFVPRGTAGRTDWITRLDLAAIYSFQWMDRAQVELRAEIFNVLNAESAREVYEFAATDPTQFRLPTSYQRPRYLRFGAAIRF